MGRTSSSRKLFMGFNCLLLGSISIICILPFVNLLAISLSNKTAVAAGQVGLVPVGFTLKSYEYVMNSVSFVRSLGVSIQRVALGLGINMTLTVLAAYPLSKSKEAFRHRNKFAWFFVLTMLFSSSIVPWYLVIKATGLIDTIWAMVVPGGLPVFNMIVMLNFFRSLPNELEEAAFIDGANHFQILCRIFLPLSKPSLATVGLFSIVNHWNSWFDGLILMNKAQHYPLQSYLQTVVVSPEAFISNMSGQNNYKALISFVNGTTGKAAQLFIATIPVLLIYPFIQKYFTTGLTVGSVKG